MKILIAGATGALGARLVPTLVDGGHDVVAMTRSPGKADGLRALGAEPVIADGLDREAVMQAVVRAEPEVIVHQMTALANVTSMKKFDDEFALTNRLRTEGTDHLVEAARAAGARRLVAQSYGMWNYERTGSGLKTEDDPLDPSPPANQRRSLEAIRHLESAVLGSGLEGMPAAASWGSPPGATATCRRAGRAAASGPRGSRGSRATRRSGGRRGGACRW